MSRCIDADAVKEKIADIWDGRPISFLGARILAMLDEIPTIDAVSVVRCKECKHWHGGWCNLEGWCNLFGSDNDADDFCSYGERSE